MYFGWGTVCVSPEKFEMTDMGPSSTNQSLRGHMYNGASALSGKLNGVQVYVTQKHPIAVYFHWCASSLNLAMSKACSTAPIRNCMAIVVNRFLKIISSLSTTKSTSKQ
jgi:hypothetical protein